MSSDFTLSALERVAYVPPVDPSSFGTLWIGLSIVGTLLTMLFFAYEVSVERKERSFFKELVLASVSAVTLGVGLFFLLLWAGLWV